jgi:hypothetical protein
MSRLPTPGGDNNRWGDLLNDFLLQQHNTDGTHNVGAMLQVPASTGLSLVSDAGQTNGFSWMPITKTTVGLSNVTNDTQVKATDVDIDTSLSANSDIKIASQKAVKSYVDMQVAALNQQMIALSTAL